MKQHRMEFRRKYGCRQANYDQQANGGKEDFHKEEIMTLMQVACNKKGAEIFRPFC
tara:strand:- start:42 stop:209 length:168 start_codon:yes stop_codon:yes gene_type:complete